MIFRKGDIPSHLLKFFDPIEELGQEKSFKDYLDNLTNIFDLVYPVLKDEGTLWVVIGDTYFSRFKGTGGLSKKQVSNSGSYYSPLKFEQELPDKCLVDIPHRFAIDMTDNHNWILRNTLIWHKLNQMPTSAKDRFTQDFEYVFLFSKQNKYYFERQLEPALSKPNEEIKEYKTKTDIHYLHHWQKNERAIHGKNAYSEGCMRNKRAVWDISTQPSKEKHFAIFPEKLIETPILAGCPENGTVLDIFFGTGTTGIVAERLNRNWLGIEVNKDYCEISKNRLTGEK